MQPDSIGKRLRTLRVRRGLSLRALAAQAQVPPSTISHIETGVRPGAGLTLKTAQKLCWVLGVGLGELAGALSDHELHTTKGTIP